MEDYPIVYEHKKQDGSFYIVDDDVKLAELTYVRKDTYIVINHTYVDKLLQGKGIAKRLVLEAVSWAREQGIKIMPTCAYAQVVFEKDPALQDVLK